MNSPANPLSGGPVRNEQNSQAHRMDKMYRFTRHIYDLTRRYYLFGRDRLVDQIVTDLNSSTLEVGCGTARNLIRLAQRKDRGLLFGLDASHEMLETADLSVSRALAGPIVLRQGLAEDLDAKRMFGKEEPFDTIFFSYCLSMIPTWQPAIDAALNNLRTGGTLWIVDFWDQKTLPALFSFGLQRWLALFHVKYRPELHEALVSIGTSGKALVTFETVGSRYAYIAKVVKI